MTGWDHNVELQTAPDSPAWDCSGPWSGLPPDSRCLVVPVGTGRRSLRAPLRRTRENHLHLYLGAANGWIYQSQDGGKTWARLARIGNRDDLVIDNILVDPANPKHLVVGAYVVADGGGYLYQ